MKQKKKSMIPRKALYILIGGGIGIIVGVGAYRLIQVNHLKNNSAEQLEARADLDFAAQRAQQLKARGIKIDPVPITSLTLPNRTWSDTFRTFKLTKAYLMPHPADFGVNVVGVNQAESDFVAVEVAITDKRTSGEADAPTSLQSAVYLKTGNRYFPAKSVGGSYRLSPRESGTTFVIIPVPKDTTAFTLLIGGLETPQTITLDFESPKATTEQGIFMINRGFATEYKETY